MENVKTFEERLLQFQTEIGIIKKDAKNPHFKNTYASLEQILAEVKPILTACELILLQPINEKGVCTQIRMMNGGETDFIESFIPVPVGLQPQPLGSAITYFRRYTLASLLSLEIDDDDAQQATKQPAKEEPKFHDTTSDKPWLNKDTDDFFKFKEWIKEGGKDKEATRITKIKEKFKLSAEVTKLLTTHE